MGAACRVRDARALRFEDAEVIGYEPLEGAMPNDPKDRHVLAAATITFNLADSATEALQPFAVQAMPPMSPCSNI